MSTCRCLPSRPLTYLPTYLPATTHLLIINLSPQRLFTCLPTHLPSYVVILTSLQPYSYLNSHPPTSPPTYTYTHLSIHPPPIHPRTYLPIYLTDSHLPTYLPGTGRRGQFAVVSNFCRYCWWHVFGLCRSRWGCFRRWRKTLWLLLQNGHVPVWT